MEVIDPKRKILNEALAALEEAEEILRGIKKDMDENYEELNRREIHYSDEMKKQKEVEDKIKWLEEMI